MAKRYTITKYVDLEVEIDASDIAELLDYEGESLVDRGCNFRALAAAIRRGDQAEAKLQLDRIADACGASEEVERGWFQPAPAWAVAA